MRRQMAASSREENCLLFTPVPNRVALAAPLKSSSRLRKLSTGVFFLAMFLAESLLRSDGLDQAGLLQSLLQSFPLSDIHDQRSLVSCLKGAASRQEQANGAAVFTGFDSYCSGHHCSLLEPDIRPGAACRIAHGTEQHHETKLKGK
jgi:hypothetical protein